MKINIQCSTTLKEYQILIQKLLNECTTFETFTIWFKGENDDDNLID